MELIVRTLPNNGVIEGKLPEDDIKNLWKLIDEAKQKPDDMRNELAGNITSSIRLDAQSPLMETFMKETLNSFVKKHIDSFNITELKEIQNILFIEDEIIHQWYFNKKNNTIIPNSRISQMLKEYKI